MAVEGSVFKKVKPFDYLIETAPGVHKHVNLLREYVSRDISAVASVSILLESEVPVEGDVQKVVLRPVPTVQTETVEDVVVNKALSHEKRLQVQQVVRKHTDMMTDLPGSVDNQTHEVKKGW